MNVVWVRGAEKIPLNRPNTDFICSPIRGGGKSSLLEHRAESYLKRGHTVVDFFGCYSNDTQVLTKNDWKPFKELTRDDEIATLNPWNRVEYYRPTAIQQYNYEGGMVYFGGDGATFDLLVTSDHQMLVDHQDGQRCIRRALELLLDYNPGSDFTQWRLLRGSGKDMLRIPIKHSSIKVVPYRGTIHDVTVPNHTLYVKRNKDPVWSCNSRDGEGLAWCRHPQVKSEEKKLALVHSDNVTVASSYDTIPVSTLKQRHLEEYDILVSASPIHNGLSDEYRNVNYITDLLYERGAIGYEKLAVGVVREASSLYYSRLKVDSNQSGAKAYMIYLIREARHMGLALELDTLKFTSIDLDIRILCDYIYLKAQGYLGLPSDLSFLYGYFKPNFIRSMNPSQFVILSKNGGIGVGIFPEVMWHKQEKENMLRLLDITVEPHEGMVMREDLGHYKTVGDKEHLAMIEAVAPKKLRNLRGLGSERKSFRTIARELKVSPSTVTVHLAKHDSAVEQHGYCPTCRRAGGLLFQDRIRGEAG